MFATIIVVTLDGHAVTPSATTPWSAANRTSFRGSVTGLRVCWISASRAARSSSRPKLPGGFVKLSRWARMASGVNTVASVRGGEVPL